MSLTDIQTRIPEDAFIPEAPFTPFPKIARLFRPIVITEKIDGTNAAVVVSEASPYGYGDEEVVGPGIVINGAYEEGTPPGMKVEWEPLYVYAQSRSKVISPEQDNFGFARWVREHARELALGLGIGVHYGEWWGSGIQRGYGLTNGEKRFSLLDVSRWADVEETRPDCCHCVPVLAELDTFDTEAVKAQLLILDSFGSKAVPGYMNPEGIVIYHGVSNSLFKATIKGDDKGKEHGA